MGQSQKRTRVTIRLDGKLIEAGRELARRRGMSLPALVRSLLEETVSSSRSRKLERFFAIADKAGGDSKGRKWSREELHQRGEPKGRGEQRD